MSGSIVKSGSGVGPSGDPAPTAPVGLSTDANNLATLGSDSKILVPTSSIWNVRLRSFNSVGNPSFEVDQRNVGTVVTSPFTAFCCDRWQYNRGGSTTATVNTQRVAAKVPLPGTNFLISANCLTVTLTAQMTSLSGFLGVTQYIEGPMARELANDVSSISLLVSSSVSGLKFGLALRDSAGTYSISKLCTIPAANTWTLVQLPNLPVFPSAGSFPITPGNVGYQLWITLGADSTVIPPANDVWQTSGGYIGAIGQSNFAASPVNSLFQIAFIQHEPGSQCTQLIDKPFAQNLWECQRYYCKNFTYPTLPAAATNQWRQMGTWVNGTTARFSVNFPRELAVAPSTITMWGVGAAANTVFVDEIGDIGIGTFTYNSTGIGGGTLGSTPSTTLPPMPLLGNYTADTGW